MGRELDPIFFKTVQFLGVIPPPPPPPVENIDRCIRTKKVVVLSFLWNIQQRCWSDWANAQTDLSSLDALVISFVLFCWGPYKNVSATFMHSTLLTYNAPAGTSAPWSFLHRECAIEKAIWLSYGPMMMMIVVMPDGGFGGGAMWHEGYHHYLKLTNSIKPCLVFSNTECWTVFPKDLLSDYSALSNRNPPCLLKHRASAKGASDRKSAMNNQRVKWQKRLSTGLADSGPVSLSTRDGGSWTRRHCKL